MSLYNQLFGVNPISPVLLAILGKKADDFGRFRDAYLEEDGEHIVIYTRCGGGNRDDYGSVFEEMAAHPNFVEDYDSDFDTTYCSFKFTVPAEAKPAIKKLLETNDPRPPMDKFKQMLDDLVAGTKTPATERAVAVGREILDKVEAGAKKVEI